MCGRFVIKSSPEEIRRLFGYVEQPNFPPRYNIAPTQPVPIVHQEHGLRHFLLVRWGLIPSWVKDPKQFSLLINARLEGITTKPSFRAAMRRRRCLVPADGFYEWKKEANGKRPHFIRARVGGPFAFAGLWETWVDRDGGEIDTAAIVTCDANATLAPIHKRMPVIVPPEHFEAWLDCDHVKAEEAAALVGPAPDDLLEACEISTRVNAVKNDGPENIEPVA
ncbi:MAG: SOS response-associated peptidase [Bradyrhizobiaceae bacterium]|nr:SOS response-associated peptidase [Bradyrhizobiaceae bacterium]